LIVNISDAIQSMSEFWQIVIEAAISATGSDAGVGLPKGCEMQFLFYWTRNLVRSDRSCDQIWIGMPLKCRLSGISQIHHISVEFNDQRSTPSSSLLDSAV
jgi:hypothetical protein